jgi:hypothetical protein
MSDHDDVLERLRAIERVGPDDLSAERVRRRAQAALAEEQSRARRLWSRVVLPALLAAACTVYVVWAVDFTARLYR